MCFRSFIDSQILIVAHTICLIHQRWWTLTIFIVSTITMSLWVCVLKAQFERWYCKAFGKTIDKKCSIWHISCVPSHLRFVLENCIQHTSEMWCNAFSIFFSYHTYTYKHITSFSPGSIFESFRFSHATNSQTHMHHTHMHTNRHNTVWYTNIKNSLPFGQSNIFSNNRVLFGTVSFSV